ncbi:MAG: ribonuclease III [Kiritimatiellia bacterium]|jgi:ribonuclease-3
MDANDTSWAAAVADLERALGYAFRDPALLRTALTHPSYRTERQAGADNQRLEFLGDAVLGFLLADCIYHAHEDHPEGMLTILRASIANGAALAAKARALGLGPALLLGRGEEITGGRDRESDLSDAFESILGAVYIDGGFDAVSAVFERVFADEVANLAHDPWIDNPKGKLQNLAIKNHGVDPVYETLAETGPVHNRVFTARVTVGEALAAEGSGASKRAAQAAAAAALLKQLKEREA